MAEDVTRLFDDYAARFARGERPDVRVYLAHAGDGAEELGRLIDGYLSRAPAPPPDEDAVALAAAWVAGEPPLRQLRARRNLEPDAVVDGLVRALGLDPKKREKVKRYYHQLESGLLEPRRVDRRVFAALAESIRARVEDLVSWRPRPLPPALYHAPAAAAAMQAPGEPARYEAEPEPDEIDRLFGVAPSS